MSNRLASETSPYLLQHAENPVDWMPWGEPAFEKARDEDKPIFLSVGYSSCHWCHVMAHESFEDEATAELLNAEFVPVKVDREERPDVDTIYMDAVQAMTGRGGWPMSVFLTPDGAPFYGGTYYPRTSRAGVPAFQDVLRQVAHVWKTQRTEVLASGAKLALTLEHDDLAALSPSEPFLDRATLDNAIQALEDAFDRAHAGFGTQPKFPQPMVLEFLLRRYVKTRDPRVLLMATATLDEMAFGGVYDQLGGGFHRYSVDRRWRVPHFEKMLYDNAQLARAYTHAWQVTKEPLYRRIATETLDYIAREMTSPDGGFYSSQDADSEGVEGAFFVWTPEEVAEALGQFGEQATLFSRAYGLDAELPVEDMFDHSRVLFVAHDAEELARHQGVPVATVAEQLASMRAAMFESRERRPRPARDEKIVASSNGLALAAFAEAARAFSRDDYLELAERNAEFVLSELRTPEGRVYRSWKGGTAKISGYLEDYADLAEGLLQLYQSTFDARWFAAARDLSDVMLEHFADPSGGFFDTSDDAEALIARPKESQDGAEPSGGSAATALLLKLGAFTGDERYTTAAEGALLAVRGALEAAPLGFTNWLGALDFDLAPPQEVAIVGEEPGPFARAVFTEFRPDVVVAARKPTEPAEVPILEKRGEVEGKTAAYICEACACSAPDTDVGAFVAHLEHR